MEHFGTHNLESGNQLRRSQRKRHTLQTLNDYEMFPATAITTEGDLV